MMASELRKSEGRRSRRAGAIGTIVIVAGLGVYGVSQLGGFDAFLEGISNAKKAMYQGIKEATKDPVDNILEYEEGKYAIQFSDGQIFTFVDGTIGFREGFLAPMRRSVGPVLSSKYGWALEEVTEEVNRRAGLYGGKHLQHGQRVLVPAFPDSALEHQVSQAYTAQTAQTAQQAGN